MANPPRDLWPEGIDIDTLSPAMILNEQAEVLVKRTAGIFQPEVRVTNFNNGFEELTFDLVAPATSFRHRILYLRQREEAVYPALVIAPIRLESLANEPPFTVLPESNRGPWGFEGQPLPNVYQVDDPESLIATLSLIFQSDYVRSSLLSQIAKINEKKTQLSRIKRDGVKFDAASK